jgi:hypothetical protein
MKNVSIPDLCAQGAFECSKMGVAIMDQISIDQASGWQGLTLVHVTPQPEPFLSQKHTPNTP